MTLAALLTECAPNVAPMTMARILKHESGNNPLAIGVNGGTRLKRQPRSAAEAAVWARWLVAQGYNVDLGMAQINHRNLLRLGLSYETAFEPCANVRAAARILSENYRDAMKIYNDSQQALHAALSAYNTGQFESRIGRHYVGKLVEVDKPNLTMRVPHR